MVSWLINRGLQASVPRQSVGMLSWLIRSGPLQNPRHMRSGPPRNAWAQIHTTYLLIPARHPGPQHLSDHAAATLEVDEAALSAGDEASS